MAARKPLKRLVIHCTATPLGREVTAEEIRHWHTDPVSKGGRGWRQVGYTDLIHLDGRVERLVDNNEDAMVDPWEVTNGDGHTYAGATVGDASLCGGFPPSVPRRGDLWAQRAGGESLPQFRRET